RAEDPVWLDVEEFETAIARAEAAADLKTQRAALDRAIELYRGDLLPNCDDEWLSAERQRLSQLMMQALEQSIFVLERTREYRAAIARAQHLLKLDALYEPGYKALMRLHVRLGDRASALQVYHQCMTQLREELGIDPSADMQTLYQHLLEDREPAVALSPVRSEEVTVHRTSTVGRDREWQVMQQWLSASSSDLLLLLGEPGIGKTRMLEELAALVKSQGGTVLWGRGYAAELLRPYGAWIDALRSVVDVDFALRADLPDELGALLPELGLPDAAIADRGRLFDAVTQAIGRIAEHTSPIVAIFDDMQWLDEASVALLHYALRVLRGTRVRFACSARSQNVADHPATATFVQALRRDRAVRELLLEPLDKIAIRELVSSVDGVARESVTEIGDRIHTDSGGNPLLALAAARTLG
ncbi:MAG: BTAD domain-containing putative transcriptional regulator, partial [Cyanobacteria bacterium J06648_11]